MLLLIVATSVPRLHSVDTTFVNSSTVEKTTNFGIYSIEVPGTSH